MLRPIRLALPIGCALLFGVLPSESAAGTREVPESLTDAAGAFRDAAALEAPARCRELLELESNYVAALAARLANRRTRPGALAEIARSDGSLAESIREALGDDDASGALPKRLVAPYIDKYVTPSLDRVFESSMRAMCGRIEREERAILAFEPNDALVSHDVKVERVRVWLDLVESVKAAVFDYDSYSNSDRGAAGQAQIDALVERLRRAHDQVAKVAEPDLRALLRANPHVLAFGFGRAESWRRAWTACERLLSIRDGLQLEPPATTLERNARGRITRALVLFASGERKTARGLLKEEDVYARALLGFLFHEQVARYNDTLDTGNMTPPDKQERDVVRHLNEYRLALDLMPLEIDLTLVSAARGHSADMASNGFFSHNSPDSARRTPADRTRLAGYRNSSVGECIFHAPSSRVLGAKVFNAWFESSPHHRLLLSTNYRQIGVGRSSAHFTADFGAGSVLDR